MFAKNLEKQQQSFPVLTSTSLHSAQAPPMDSQAPTTHSYASMPRMECGHPELRSSSVGQAEFMNFTTDVNRERITSAPLQANRKVTKKYPQARAILTAPKRLKTPRRKEQCRMSQTRYRNKQRDYELSLGTNVAELRQEIERLRRLQQEAQYRRKSSLSAWCAVTESFCLLEIMFWSPWGTEYGAERSKMKQSLAILKKSFAQNVAVGDLTGVDALMRHVQRYSQCFQDPKLHLKNVEEVAPGIMAATVQLNVTLSRLTLRSLSPHLIYPCHLNNGNETSLVQRLIDQRLECSGSKHFLFNEDSRTVVRLDINIDWITPLFRALGSMKDVATVLDGALISSEGIVGDT